MKGSDINIPSIFYVIMIITGLVVITGGMMHAKAVLIPLMMAAFITIISSGPLSWFKEKGFPQWLALLVSLALFCLVTTLALLVVASSMKEFVHNIPEYQNTLQQQMEQFSAFLGSKGVHLEGKRIADIFNPSSAIKYVGHLFDGLSNLLAQGFLIMFLVIFMLSEVSGLSGKLNTTYGDGSKTILQLHKFNDSVQQYILIKTLTSLGTGILATLCLLVIGVDYPIMWGMLAFALNFIPSIGSIMAAVPPILLAIVQIGPASALATAACYLVINISIGTFIEPRFMGKQLGLSPLVVFLSLLFWGWVLGPVGMLLSVVLTMKLKIMLDSNEETQWLGVLLGPNPTEECTQEV